MLGENTSRFLPPAAASPMVSAWSPGQAHQRRQPRHAGRRRVGPRDLGGHRTRAGPTPGLDAGKVYVN